MAQSLKQKKICDFDFAKVVFAALLADSYQLWGEGPITIEIEKFFFYKTKNGNYVLDDGRRCKVISKSDAWEEIKRIKRVAPDKLVSRIVLDEYVDDFEGMKEA